MPFSILFGKFEPAASHCIALFSWRHMKFINTHHSKSKSTLRHLLGNIWVHDFSSLWCTMDVARTFATGDILIYWIYATCKWLRSKFETKTETSDCFIKVCCSFLCQWKKSSIHSLPVISDDWSSGPIYVNMDLSKIYKGFLSQPKQSRLGIKDCSD